MATIIDIHTGETLKSIPWDRDNRRAAPETFGMIRYHNFPPELPKKPQNFQRTNLLDAMSPDDIVGSYPKLAHSLDHLVCTLEERVAPLQYPQPNPQYDLKVIDALEIRFRSLYPDKSDETNVYHWQVYTLRKRDLVTLLHHLRLDIKDYFYSPDYVVPQLPPNQNGDWHWHSEVLNGVPNKEVGNAHFSHRDRPVTRHNNMSEVSAFPDPLHDYGVRKIPSSGLTSTLVYACCFQPMRSPGCIIGYPWEKRPDTYLYQWFGGHEPSEVTLEYRGIAYKDTTKYDDLHEKIKGVLRELLWKLQKPEAYEKLLGDDELRDLAQVAEWIYEYNYVFDQTFVRPFPRPDEIPEKRAEMIAYLRRVIRTKKTAVPPPPPPPKGAEDVSRKIGPEIWTYMTTKSLEEFEKFLERLAPDIRNNLIRMHRLVKLDEKNIRIIFDQYRKDPSEDPKKFLDGFEQQLQVRPWKDVIANGPLFEYRQNLLDVNQQRQADKLLEISELGDLENYEQRKLEAMLRAFDAGQNVDINTFYKLENESEISSVFQGLRDKNSEYAQYLIEVRKVLNTLRRREVLKNVYTRRGFDLHKDTARKFVRQYHFDAELNKLVDMLPKNQYDSTALLNQWKIVYEILKQYDPKHPIFAIIPSYNWRVMKTPDDVSPNVFWISDKRARTSDLLTVIVTNLKQFNATAVRTTIAKYEKNIENDRKSMVTSKRTEEQQTRVQKFLTSKTEEEWEKDMKWFFRELESKRQTLKEADRKHFDSLLEVLDIPNTKIVSLHAGNILTWAKSLEEMLAARKQFELNLYREQGYVMKNAIMYPKSDKGMELLRYHLGTLWNVANGYSYVSVDDLRRKSDEILAQK